MKKVCIKKIKFFTNAAFLFAGAAVCFSSCSLKYVENVNVEEAVPEFVFEGTTISSFEDNKITYLVTAEKLEQYKNSAETYAKGVSFVSYDGDDPSTEGSCGMLFADSDNKTYELFENISLTSHSDNIKFTAEMLKWDEITEQLVSSKSGFVQVQTEDSTIRGTGFSSSGISKNFSFAGNVVGTIDTEKNEFDEAASGEEIFGEVAGEAGAVSSSAADSAE